MAGINLATGRSGPTPKSPIDGDKKQARQRLNVEVRTGRRQHPNALACVYCGHKWNEGGRRHEYHHHKGYGPESHYDVVPACTTCHDKQDNPKAIQTHCIRGHAFSPENTRLKPNGTRICLECRRARERNRGRDAKYWREYRARKQANG